MCFTFTLSAISYDANGNPTVAYGPNRREWKLIGPDNFINTGSDNDEYYLYDVAGRRVGTYKLTATFYPPQGSFTTIEWDYWFGSRLIYRWTPTGAGLQARLGSVRGDSGTNRYGSM